MDLCGDLGGVVEVIVFVFGVVMYQVSKFSYELKLMEKLYVVKTADAGLFRMADLGKKPAVPKGREAESGLVKLGQKEADNFTFFNIKLSLYNKMKLKAFDLGRPFIKKRSLGNQGDLLLQVYDEARRQLEKDLSLEKIVQRLRNLQTLVHQKVIGKELGIPKDKDPEKVFNNVIDITGDSGSVFAQHVRKSRIHNPKQHKYQSAAAYELKKDGTVEMDHQPVSLEKKKINARKKKDPKKIGKLSNSSDSDDAEFSDLRRPSGKNSQLVEVSRKGRKRGKKSRRNQLAPMEHSMDGLLSDG